MADFCYDCTKDILGINPEMNDFNLEAVHYRMEEGEESYWVLCEGCGPIRVDECGQRVEPE